jgi:hypothetical protein
MSALLPDIAGESMRMPSDITAKMQRAAARPLFHRLLLVYRSGNSVHAVS